MFSFFDPHSSPSPLIFLLISASPGFCAAGVMAAICAGKSLLSRRAGFSAPRHTASGRRSFKEVVQKVSLGFRCSLPPRSHLLRCAGNRCGPVTFNRSFATGEGAYQQQTNPLIQAAMSPVVKRRVVLYCRKLVPAKLDTEVGLKKSLSNHGRRKRENRDVAKPPPT